MVKREDKQKVIWKIGRIDELFVGKDSIIGGVRIKAAKGFLNNQSNCISHWNLTVTLSLIKTELGMTKEWNISGKYDPKASTFPLKQRVAASVKLNDMIEETDI